MSLVDRDKSAEIEVEEFKVLMTLALVPPSKEEETKDLEAFFTWFDTDGSGTTIHGHP